MAGILSTKKRMTWDESQPGEPKETLQCRPSVTWTIIEKVSNREERESKVENMHNNKK